MCACMFDIFPMDGRHCGGWDSVDVLLVFVEEVVHKLVQLLYIAMVDG